MKICLECHKEYEPRAKNQIYCNVKCNRKQYLRKYLKKNSMVIKEVAEIMRKIDENIKEKMMMERCGR